MAESPRYQQPETETGSDLEVVVFSDYICPFCYLGKASLEEYLAGTDDSPPVTWHQFDLRGYERGPDGALDPSVDTGKDDQYFERVRQNVERLAEKYGVEMAWDLGREIDSWNAQQLALFVQRSRPARFPALNDHLFDAVWQDGRDVGNPDVLVDLAKAVGIDESDVRSALADDGLEAALAERFAAAKQAGITGVPTFSYGNHAARGAVPPAQLRRLIEGE